MDLKNIVQVGSITAILIIVSFLLFTHMTTMVEQEVGEDELPTFIMLSFATITCISVAIGTYKWFPWLKDSRKFSTDIIFNPVFFVWFVTAVLIADAVSVYYVYKTFPDFQHGWIFDLVSIVMIGFLIYCIIRAIHKIYNEAMEEKNDIKDKY